MQRQWKKKKKKNLLISWNCLPSHLGKDAGGKILTPNDLLMTTVTAFVTRDHTQQYQWITKKIRTSFKESNPDERMTESLKQSINRLKCWPSANRLYQPQNKKQPKRLMCLIMEDYNNNYKTILQTSKQKQTWIRLSF